MTILKIISLLDKDLKRKFVFLSVFVFISMLLEILSIGMILPLISSFLEPDLLLNKARSALGIEFKTTIKLTIVALVLLLSVFILKNVFLIFKEWYQIKFTQGTHLFLSDKLYKSYLTRKYSFFIKTNSAKLIRNMVGEVGSTVEYINKTLLTFNELLVFFGIGIFLLLLEPKATLIVLLITLSLSLIFYLVTKKRISNWAKKRLDYLEKSNKHLIQGISGIKDLKILGRYNDFINQFKLNIRNVTQINASFGFLTALPKYFFEILIIFSFVVLASYLAIIEQDVNKIIQTLGVFTISGFRLLPATSRILSGLQAIKFRKVAAQVINNEIISTEDKEKIENPIKVNGESKEFFKSNICLKNISFSYWGTPKKVLNNINIDIKKGDLVGIIGQTGSGKSTLIDVIVGLLKPTDGTVEVDSKDINKNIRDWQNQIGYVAQSIYLTDDTIKKNIAFGLENDQINDDLVNLSIKQSQLFKFINSLPDGAETIVGEKGIKISGGQRQRIGIARALYHNPPVIILDEATSSLNQEIEEELIRTIENFKTNKTILISTHRLSSLKNCDYIINIENGKIVMPDSKKFSQITN